MSDLAFKAVGDCCARRQIVRVPAAL